MAKGFLLWWPGEYWQKTTGNEQGLLPFISKKMRPRQLLSFLDREKAQQPSSAM